MRLGTLDIRKAYLGSRELTQFDSVVGERPLIGMKPVQFKALADNSSIGLNKISSHQKLWYSLDDVCYYPLTTSVTVSLNNDDIVYVKGSLTDDNSTSDYTQFTMTGSIKLSGNINALWNIPDPNTKLHNCCGYYLFDSCSSLADIDDLEMPAMNLSDYCYYRMFKGSSIISAPENLLPALSMKPYCYTGLFFQCTNLSIPAKLPATTLAPYCYSAMFRECSALATCPSLPAAALAEHCYDSMFSYCNSLVTPSVLSASILFQNCYAYMFYNCTSLTTAPELIAANLVPHCYENMFDGCSSLNHIKCLATNISASMCVDHWVRSVSQTGTFIKDANTTWPSGDSGIPNGWTIQDAS